MIRNKPITTILATILGIGLGIIPSLSSATIVNVIMDTSPLSGAASSVVFDFLDGDAAPNNSVTLSNFSFGGGSPSGIPDFTCTSGTGVSCGGITGDLSSVVTMSDNFDFFNEFVAEFIPGNELSFTMAFSENFAGGTPDSFLFSLLDSNGDVIPTTSNPSGTNTFLSLEIASSSIIEVSDSPDSGISAPTFSPVPEPDITALLIIGMMGSIFCRFPAKQRRLNA